MCDILSIQNKIILDVIIYVFTIWLSNIMWKLRGAEVCLLTA